MSVMKWITSPQLLSLFQALIELGSGLVVAKTEAGTWSAPSAIMVSSFFLVLF
jgi:hypothetical protein